MVPFENSLFMKQFIENYLLNNVRGMKSSFGKQSKAKYHFPKNIEIKENCRTEQRQQLATRQRKHFESSVYKILKRKSYPSNFLLQNNIEIFLYLMFHKF